MSKALIVLTTLVVAFADPGFAADCTVTVPTELPYGFVEALRSANYDPIYAQSGKYLLTYFVDQKTDSSYGDWQDEYGNKIDIVTQASVEIALVEPNVDAPVRELVDISETRVPKHLQRWWIFDDTSADRALKSALTQFKKQLKRRRCPQD